MELACVKVRCVSKPRNSGFIPDGIRWVAICDRRHNKAIENGANLGNKSFNRESAVAKTLTEFIVRRMAKVAAP